MKNFLFIELQEDSLVDGKAFDGLVAGTFTDMSGRKVEFTDEDLIEITKNTARAIEATKTESGEIVGLAIDAKGHEEGDGAGWIVDVKLENGIVRFTPKWTKIGLELIDEGIRRFFSAVVDLTRKVVRGGTLTNWPATRDNKTGDVLLRPIELAHLEQSIFALQDDSLDDQIHRVYRAWFEQYDTIDGPDAYPVEVFEDHLIIDRNDGFFKVPYSLKEDAIVFSDPAEWSQVRKTWTELMQAIGHNIARLLGGRGIGIESPKGTVEILDEGEDEMGKFDIAKLSEEDRALLMQSLITELGLNPDDFGTDQNKDVGHTISQLVDARAAVMVEEATKAAAKESEIAKLTDTLTGGDENKAVGLPVEADELKSFLESLSDEQREVATKIFESIQEKGLVNFEENGHRRILKGASELPDEMKLQLKNFLEGDEEATVAEFFETNEDMLGVMSDYNVSEFEREEENG